MRVVSKISSIILIPTSRHWGKPQTSQWEMLFFCLKNFRHRKYRNIGCKAIEHFQHDSTLHLEH